VEHHAYFLQLATPYPAQYRISGRMIKQGIRTVPQNPGTGKTRQTQQRDFSRSRVGEYENGCLLGRFTVSGRNVPKFRGYYSYSGGSGFNFGLQTVYTR
jgi:hypothetical protein